MFKHKKDENVSNTCKILQIRTIQMAPNLGSLYYFYKNILNCKIINFYHPKGRNSRIDAKFKFISKLHRHIVQCRWICIEEGFGFTVFVYNGGGGILLTSKEGGFTTFWHNL